MVAMGTSLADRAWSRESAVFRITGVISVIGGWFITAGAALIICFIVTNALFFGSFVTMVIAIAIAVTLIIRSNIKYGRNDKKSETDELFNEIIHSEDKSVCWNLLRKHVRLTTKENLQLVAEKYEALTTAFFYEDYRTIKRTTVQTESQRKEIKRQRIRRLKVFY